LTVVVIAVRESLVRGVGEGVGGPAMCPADRALADALSDKPSVGL
jgi:hypothetical protein